LQDGLHAGVAAELVADRTSFVFKPLKDIQDVLK
jgi:hypothetical protein